MSYLMESEQESRRLLAQQEADALRARVLSAGLESGSAVVDVGCGPGLGTQVIAEIVGGAGRAVGVERSAERVQIAREHGAGRRGPLFVQGDVYALPFGEGAFDFAFSQFLFQYLPEPARALGELVRVVRPGGKVVIAEVDGAGLGNWPFPSEIETGARQLLAAVASHGFDVHIGRKLFALFREAGLRAVKVRVGAHYVFAGPADERAIEDWRVRFETLAPVVAPKLGGDAAFRSFRDAYLGMLSDPDTLNFSVFLVTEGVKP